MSLTCLTHLFICIFMFILDCYFYLCTWSLWYVHVAGYIILSSFDDTRDDEEGAKRRHSELMFNSCWLSSNTKIGNGKHIYINIKRMEREIIWDVWRNSCENEYNMVCFVTCLLSVRTIERCIYMRILGSCHRESVFINILKVNEFPIHGDRN